MLISKNTRNCSHAICWEANKLLYVGHTYGYVIGYDEIMKFTFKYYIPTQTTTEQFSPWWILHSQRAVRLVWYARALSCGNCSHSVLMTDYSLRHVNAASHARCCCCCWRLATSRICLDHISRQYWLHFELKQVPVPPAEQKMGQRPVIWVMVNKCECVMCFTGQCRKTLDPWLNEV